MKAITVYQYDAFSKEPNKGNPAGIVFNGDELTKAEMQEIALKVGFNARNWFRRRFIECPNQRNRRLRKRISSFTRSLMT